LGTRRPDALALWCIDESDRRERKITFADVTDNARRAANFFQGCGIKRGDPVLVILPRIPEWWICMLGLIRLGQYRFPVQRCSP